MRLQRAVRPLARAPWISIVLCSSLAWIAINGGSRELSIYGTSRTPLVMVNGRIVPLAITDPLSIPGGIIGDTVSLRSYGAVGDGAIDDTAAFQAAINTGKTVICRGGDSYLVNGGLTSSSVGQVIDMTGCIVKLKTSAGHRGLLAVSGSGAGIRGGEWDMNLAGNPSQGFAQDFNAWAFSMTGNWERVEDTYVHDTAGECVQAIAVNHFAARRNRCENTSRYGIYVDASGADTTDVEVIDNYLTYTSQSQGIGIYSINGFLMRRIKVLDNTVIAPLSGATSADVAITVRGAEEVISNNVVRGSTIGISVDAGATGHVGIPQNCAIVGNVVQGANGQGVGGGVGYGIELNAGACSISGNFIQDGDYGIAASLTAGGQTMDHTSIVGNVILSNATYNVAINAGGGSTAHWLNISGNVFSSTKIGITLVNDCKYALIEGNIFHGPGSGTANSRGVLLDTVNSDVQIIGNRFQAYQRAAGASNPGAVAQDRMLFAHNDISIDIASVGVNALQLDNSATAGVQYRIVDNYEGTSTIRNNYWDVANNILDTFGAFSNPEGTLTAGIGSLQMSTTGAAFLKASGTGNTGWRALLGLTGTVTTDLGTVSTLTCATDVSVTVTGAKTGGVCNVGMPSAITGGLQCVCFVSAADTAKLRCCNNGAGSSAPGSLVYNVQVFN